MSALFFQMPDPIWFPPTKELQESPLHKEYKATWYAQRKVWRQTAPSHSQNKSSSVWWQDAPVNEEQFGCSSRYTAHWVGQSCPFTPWCPYRVIWLIQINFEFKYWVTHVCSSIPAHISKRLSIRNGTSVQMSSPLNYNNISNSIYDNMTCSAVNCLMQPLSISTYIIKTYFSPGTTDTKHYIDFSIHSLHFRFLLHTFFSNFNLWILSDSHWLACLPFFFFRIVLISGRRSFYSVFSVLPYRDCSQTGYVSDSMPNFVTSSLCSLLLYVSSSPFLWVNSPVAVAYLTSLETGFGGCIFTLTIGEIGIKGCFRCLICL